MKQKVIGYQFIKYVKDGQEKQGYKFHLVSMDSITDNGEGKVVESIYFNSANQGVLIDKFMNLYKSGKPFIVYYNRFGRVDGVIE